MAEALVNHFLGDQWSATSAGTQPAGYVHPKAIQALAELSIEHHGVSKSISDLESTNFDLAITVCDNAAENCPVWLGKGVRHHIGFPDPAKAQGSDEEVMGVFRQVRDDIKKEIFGFMKDF
jgi:arsenate reductase